MKTAVVILNWNTEGFLKEFLPSLLHSTAGVEGAEVIVADNASTDGSLKVMQELFPEVRTIALDKNYGFTGGYNRAFSQIDSDLFVLINSDIEVTDGWLEPLVRWMEAHPGCGACAPKLHSWQERDRFEYAGAAGGFIDRYGYPFCRGRVLKRLETDHGQYDRPAEVFWATGACLMVRSSLYRRLGGLDERFFAHMEEIDLCWRMQFAGYNVCVVPDSVVYHVGGGTLPSSSPFKLYLNYRNNLLMLDNNLAKTYALLHNRNNADSQLSAEKGVLEAGKMVRVRMMMDLMSASVYLLTLRFKAFGAVVRAHRDFRRMRTKPDVCRIKKFLLDNPKAAVSHIYGKWIVLQSLTHRKDTFAGIHETDFFKF